MHLKRGVRATGFQAKGITEQMVSVSQLKVCDDDSSHIFEQRRFER
jgi:hypothetical protein